MATDFRDALLGPLGSGEPSLQLPLAPLVVDPAAFLPTSPVVGMPDDSPHFGAGGAGGGGVPPLPAVAPAGLGMLEGSLPVAARGSTPHQPWVLGPAAAAAPPLFVGGGAFAGGTLLPPFSPFSAGGPGAAAALPQHMQAAMLPAGGRSSGVAGPLLTAAGAQPWAPVPAALPTVGQSAAGPATEPAAAAATSAVPPPPRQQQQEPAAASQQAAQPRGGGGRSRSRGRGGHSGRGRGRARSKAAADTDSEYEAESAPSSDDEEAGDESEEERAAIETRRKERLRAKNRRAQARYRLKQKAMHEQQAAAVEAAAADLERQRLANEALRERGAALEKIASFKDLSLQALQAAAGEAAAAAGASHPAPVLRELHSGDSGSGAGTVAAAAAPAVSSGCSTGAQHAGAAAGKAGDSAQAAAASSASTGAGSSEGGGTSSSGGALRRRPPFEQRAEELLALASREQAGEVAARGSPPVPQLRDEVMGMAADDFLQDWADFGALAAHTLAELDAGLISEEQAAARLGPALQYRSLLHTAMLHYKPEVYKQLLAHTHLAGEGPEEAAQRWRRVALAMGCTRSQALQLREQYQAYCARLRQLSSDSAACMRQLSSLAQTQLGAGAGLLAGGEGEEGSFLAGRSLRSMMAGYLQLFEAAQRLARQPDAALVALLEFHTATGSVISGMQKARCAALYKPLFPDIVAIVRTCLEQHGLLPPDAGTSQAMTAGAAAGPSGLVA